MGLEGPPAPLPPYPIACTFPALDLPDCFNFGEARALGSPAQNLAVYMPPALCAFDYDRLPLHFYIFHSSLWLRVVASLTAFDALLLLGERDADIWPLLLCLRSPNAP